MSNQVLLSAIAALALAFQAQVGGWLAPVIRFPAAMSFDSVCTGVDLNVGCVPVELTSQQPTGR